MRTRVCFLFAFTFVLTACSGDVGGLNLSPPGASVAENSFAKPAVQEPCEFLVLRASSGTIRPGQNDSLSVYEYILRSVDFDCVGPPKIYDIVGTWSSNGGHLHPLVGHTTAFGAHKLGSYTVEVHWSDWRPASTTIVVN